MAIYMDASSSMTELLRSSGIWMIVCWVMIAALVVTFVLSADSPFAPLSAALVGIVFMVAVFAWLRARQSKEGFDAIASVEKSSEALRQLKSNVMMPAIVQFIASGRQTNQRDSLAFGVFWQPSANDYRRVYIGNNEVESTWNIENITCTDRKSRLPVEVVSADVDAVFAESPDRENCRVFIDDGIYASTRTAIDATCKVERNGMNGNRLCLFRNALSTKTIMLLRPVFVRVGGTSSKLFKVNYGGADGLEYDSESEKDELAYLLLDDGGAWDPMRNKATEPSSDMGETVVICYFLNYLMPRAGMAGRDDVELHACTVAVAGPVGTASMYARVNNAEARILDVVVTNQPIAKAEISAIGVPPFQIPAGRAGTIVTYTRDCVIAASIGSERGRVFIKRVNTPSTSVSCKYLLANIEDGLQVAMSGVPFTKTAIPNMADFAGAMDPDRVEVSIWQNTIKSAMTASPLARAMFATPQSPNRSEDTLQSFPRESLSPNDIITSKNKRYKIKFNSSGSLVIVDAMKCDNNGIVWSSLTDNISVRPANMASIDAKTGVITLRDTHGGVYWKSSKDPLSRISEVGDVSPFRLVITDQGSAEVRGKDGRVYWIRDAQQSQPGYPKFSTCEMASAAYAQAHKAEIDAASIGTMTTISPWMHWNRYGGRDILNFDWPGPMCIA